MCALSSYVACGMRHVQVYASGNANAVVTVMLAAVAALVALEVTALAIGMAPTKFRHFLAALPTNLQQQ